MSTPVSLLMRSGSTVQLTTHDAFNWTRLHLKYRVRLNVVYKDSEDNSPRDVIMRSVARRRGFKGLLNSNSKAKVFHGYLEGDYEIATLGFYTNNIAGVARLVERYSDLFVSVQSYEQYMAAMALSEQLNTL